MNRSPIPLGQTVTIGDVARTERGTVRLHILGDVAEFDCTSIDFATLGVVPIDPGTSTLWPAAAVLEIQCTADGNNWGSAKTADFNSAPEVRTDVEVIAMRRIRVRVKTVTSDTGNFKAEITFSGKRASVMPS
jgi:hypothetical protein